MAAAIAELPISALRLAPDFSGLRVVATSSVGLRASVPVAWTVLFPVDRCRAGLRGHGLPIHGSAIRLSIEAVDRKLEGAAATLGASSIWVFAAVTLPLAFPGVLAGMVIAFAKSLWEFGAMQPRRATKPF